MHFLTKNTRPKGIRRRGRSQKRCLLLSLSVNLHGHLDAKPNWGPRGRYISSYGILQLKASTCLNHSCPSYAAHAQAFYARYSLLSNMVVFYSAVINYVQFSKSVYALLTYSQPEKVYGCQVLIWVVYRMSSSCHWHCTAAAVALSICVCDYPIGVRFRASQHTEKASSCFI